mmetsp:Transcript_35258/g.93909  ORF Transcript_35258/g.93909 Transcript_35258/m.93909 type:complete len:220 (+) Transcript_35258:857-1516(+)
MLPVQAVAVAESLVWLPGTLLAKSLVVGGIRGKASDLRHGQVHALQQRGKLVQIIRPAEPAAMSCVQIDTYFRHLCRQLIHCVLDALLVRGLCRWISTVRIGKVCGEIRKAIRLQHHHDWHHLTVFLQHCNERVNVLRRVLLQSLSAVARRIVVTCAIRILCAADLPIGSFGIAIPVRQVVPYNGHELRWRLGGRVLQNTLKTVGGVSSDLLLLINPVC